MKRTIAIFFISIYVLSTTEAGQLLKLPIIFEHYSEHRSWNGDISFLEFLDMHYMHGSPMDADYDRDMQLPFKKTDNLFSLVSPASVPSILTLQVIKPVEANKNERETVEDQHLLSPYLDAIWQPPQAL